MRDITTQFLLAAIEDAGLSFDVIDEGDTIKTRSFERCSVWNDDEAGDRILFVVGGRDGLDIAQANEDCSFLVISDEAVKAPANALVGSSKLSAPELASNIRHVLDPVIRWIDEMQMAIMKGASVQELFDVSEPMLVNWTVMADNSFRLIAYTRHIETDDELCIALAENGCHDPQVAEKLLLEHSLILWADRDEQGYSSNRPVLRYPSIARTLTHNGREAEHVLQIENNTPLTPYRRELFGKFFEHIELLVNLLELRGKGIMSPHDEFLYLVSEYGTDVTTRRFTHLARTAGIAYDRSFIIGFAEFAVDVPGMLERSASFFERSVPGCFAVPQANRLIVLLHTHSLSVEENLETARMTILMYLRENGGRLFLSAPCYDAEDLPTAYHQAEMASLVDEKLTDGEIVLFEDTMIDWMMMNVGYDPAFIEYCLTQRPFGKIVKNEKQTIVDMLKAYLEGERRATPVSEQLGVHRNSLLYQIERVQNNYDVDFDDPATRFEFRYLFRYLSLRPSFAERLRQ